ncbi:flavodoxin family protein [Bacillus piscicola]|uniref:flavodoxin family protein n=1 Tax=Bacillus piscicola TaxID=1632684 RepID=UPI0023DDF660|nr:flavodoxin family protein [Bacillus piscicola]
MAGIKALFLNTSLKASSDTSNTSALLQKAGEWLQKENVSVEEVRIADYEIKPGIEPDMGSGDEWPSILDKVKQADIIVIGTPIWLGELSSIAKRVIERLSASSDETNEKDQSIYYNKVAGVVITGNEDGAKDSARSILYALQHIGFMIPPNADTYWVGEAGPGPSYIEAGQDSEFTKKNTRTMAYNLAHFARMLKDHPIPAEGNTVNS